MPAEEIAKWGAPCSVMEKDSALKGKHGRAFSTGMSGLESVCWCGEDGGSAAKAGTAGCCAWQSHRRQSLLLVPGSACARPLANSLCVGLKISSLLDSFPCKNKYSSSASLLGMLAGAHTGFGGTSSTVGTLAGKTATLSTSPCVLAAQWAQNHRITEC